MPEHHDVPGHAQMPETIGARPTRVALVLAAHGTRSALGRERLRALRAAVSGRRDGRAVVMGFVDVQEPRLDVALRQVDAPAIVVPLFLTAGGHVRRDVTQAVASAPEPAAALPHVGSWSVIEDLLARAAAGLESTPAPGAPGMAERGALLLASAGSADAGARDEVLALAGRLHRRLGRPVLAGFLGGPGPSAADLAPTAAGILSHLLAPGHFAERADALGRAHGIPVSAPLLGGEDGLAAIAEAIAARVT